MSDKLFNYISYLGYVAFIWGGVVAFPEIINQSENIISNIGFGLFLFGIGLSLIGFKTQSEFTASESRHFSNEKTARRVILILSFVLAFPVFIGAFFLSFSFFFPTMSPEVISQFRELGYGSLSFGIGGIAMSKAQFDRFSAFLDESKKQDPALGDKM
ncbi:MAG: hypothetical protein RIM99_05260 [Cyclobacteriaceae bacterium]